MMQQAVCVDVCAASVRARACGRVHVCRRVVVHASVCA